MNIPKPGRSAEGRGEPLVDPALLRGILRQLSEANVEFPIKVEGTSTLPYASQILEIRESEGLLLLKLVRPLPPELASGAPFLMLFAVQEQRFEGEIHYLRREAYLCYLFRMPKALVPSDRRRQKRFPFRPREQAYVAAQDGALPGHVIAGPLLNLSMGGLAFRVDRVLQLDTGMRIPPKSTLFERGKLFSRIRLQGVPRLPLLEVRGTVAHVQETAQALHLGVAFGELGDEDLQALQECLSFRERILRAGPGRTMQEEGTHREGTRMPGEPAPSEQEMLESAAVAVSDPPQDPPLLRLRRRGHRLLLVMKPGPRRDRVESHLREHGYGRLEILETLEAAKDTVRSHSEAPNLWVVDLHLGASGDEEPLAAVRRIEGYLRNEGSVSLALLCEQPDPTLLLSQSPRTCYLAEDAPTKSIWAAALDGLLTPSG